MRIQILNISVENSEVCQLSYKFFYRVLPIKLIYFGRLYLFSLRLRIVSHGSVTSWDSSEMNWCNCRWRHLIYRTRVMGSSFSLGKVGWPRQKWRKYVTKLHVSMQIGSQKSQPCWPLLQKELISWAIMRSTSGTSSRRESTIPCTMTLHCKDFRFLNS
jgi:hypothetical protein